MKTAWLARGAVALAIAAVALLAIAGVAGSSERACIRCHTTVAKASAPTAHSSVACVTCHAPGAQRVTFVGDQLFRMYPAALIGKDPSGPVKEVPRENCLKCHAAIQSGITSGDLLGVKIKHKACAPDTNCGSCHSGTAHGDTVRWDRKPVMENCTACHRREQAPVKCDSCHVGRLKGDRLETGPWQITHGPNWKQTHGMGQLDSCQTCHPADYCNRCHRVEMPHPVSFGQTHGKSAIKDRAACSACHKSQQFCDSCHGVSMPHPAGFLRQHSGIAKTVSNTSCLRCHDKTDCESCHANHIHPGNARVSSGITTSTPGGGDQ